VLSKLLKKLETEGKIRKQKAGFVQIEALLKEAILDLEEAEKILHLAERATYLLAYNAMLKAGRALMLLQGYVPDDGAQHKTVVEMTSAILGDEYKHLTEQFETMRRKRNEMTYEAGTLLSKSESQRAFSDAIAVVKKILDDLKAQNPQMELKFEPKEKRDKGR
jgi:uncharacterized protein (UPF0332 family)